MNGEAQPVGVFLVGAATEYLAAILEHPSLRVVGQVPRFTMMLPLLRDCPANILLLSPASLEGWPLDQAVPRIRDLNPTLRLAILQEQAEVSPQVQAEWMFRPGVLPAEVAARLAAGPGYPEPPAPPTPEAVPSSLISLFTRAPRVTPPPTETAPDEDTRLVPPALLAVCGPKGGVGKTTLAVGLAAILAQAARGSAVLLDLDLQGADAGAHLDLLEGPTLVDALPYASENQAERALAYLQEHKATGLRVLLGPPRPDLAEVVQGDGVAELVRLFRRRFPYVVLDVPAAAGDLPDYLLAADRIILVTTLDPPALRRCRIWLDSLRQHNPEMEERVMVTLNRVRPGLAISRHQAEEFLGAPIGSEVPEDETTAARALEAGVPAVVDSPGSQLAGGLVRLAKALGAPATPATSPQGWLTRWVRR